MRRRPTKSLSAHDAVRVRNGRVAVRLTGNVTLTGQRSLVWRVEGGGWQQHSDFGSCGWEGASRELPSVAIADCPLDTGVQVVACPSFQGFTPSPAPLFFLPPRRRDVARPDYLSSTLHHVPLVCIVIHVQSTLSNIEPRLVLCCAGYGS